ncbi:hypothetical protein NHQ30_002982 [Ciborinia camelliae]|nr:hypothetical protein NHQ30_002982 [Ciborinia camelliae]
MGFFSFIGQAVGAVKNLIVVTEQGPMVDVAVPALQAIFSDGSAPPSAPQERLDQPSNIINLQRTDKMIGDILTECQKIEENMTQRVQLVSEQIKEGVAAIESLVRHQNFKNQSSKVKSAVKFFDLKQDVLKEITASSGPSAFEQIFPTNSDPAFTQERLELSKTIDNIKTDLEDMFFVPSQETIELYLVIVCRGMQAKSQEAWGQYTQYLNTLGRLRSDIITLQKDAKDAHYTLIDLVKRLTNTREAAVSWKEVPENGKQVLKVMDTWQVLGIGWKTQDEVAKAVALTKFDVTRGAVVSPESTELEDGLIRANFTLYRDVVAQTLQVYLQPCHAVIESLEDSIRNWKAHLPVSPIKFEDDRTHAVAEQPEKDVTCSKSENSKFWDLKVA